jgi:hypothetical protein
MIIDAVESKSTYLRLMKEFREATANKRRERDLHVWLKEMHTHMRETELKEEEELQQREEALKNGRKNWEYGRNN